MKTAFLFTGQGSQFAGMGKDLADRHPAAREVFDEADRVLGERLSELCFAGPEQQLALTENTQPATLTVSIAAWRALGLVPDLAAGHSLGEYSALTAAGTFTFADALRLVRERARRMQAAVPPGAGGMVVLRKTTVDEARALVSEIRSGVCDVANLNAPGQVVLAGEAAAMDEVIERVGPRTGLRLPVSVPFHSSLLSAAARGFADVLRGVDMVDPAFPIYCNVDARPVTDLAAVRDALERQFASPVLWQTSIERMLRDEGVRRFVEFGPKPTLVRMVTQIASHIGVDGVETSSVTTADDLDQLVR